MKLIIAGSRNFTDYGFLCKQVDWYIQDKDITAIISGGANGADSLGEKYSKEKNIPFELFAAEWDKYGKSAGYIRNQDMAENGDYLIVFWDGISKGTKNMIDIAQKSDTIKEVVVCKYKKIN